MIGGRGSSVGRFTQSGRSPLKRNEVDWVPVPGLTYVSYNLLAAGCQKMHPVLYRQSITVFFPDAPRRTYIGKTVLTNSLFPGLERIARQAFR